ncbi:hypothetical protein HC928_25180 [bacterium]|nr:hypothetical protein [bacterium]
MDAPPTFITISVTDTSGEGDNVRFALVIEHRAPTGVLALTDAAGVSITSTPIGQPVNVTVDVTDALADMTAGGFTYSFDCGNGTMSGPQDAAVFPCTYNEALDVPYMISVTITDKDGQISTPLRAEIAVERVNIVSLERVDVVNLANEAFDSLFPNNENIIAQVVPAGQPFTLVAVTSPDDLTTEGMAGCVVFTLNEMPYHIEYQRHYSIVFNEGIPLNEWLIENGTYTLEVYAVQWVGEPRDAAQCSDPNNPRSTTLTYTLIIER